MISFLFIFMCRLARRRLSCPKLMALSFVARHYHLLPNGHLCGITVRDSWALFCGITHLPSSLFDYKQLKMHRGKYVNVYTTSPSLPITKPNPSSLHPRPPTFSSSLSWPPSSSSSSLLSLGLVFNGGRRIKMIKWGERRRRWWPLRRDDRGRGEQPWGREEESGHGGWMILVRKPSAAVSRCWRGFGVFMKFPFFT